MKCIFRSILSLVAIGLCHAAPTPLDLFNGKDLSGWVQQGGKALYKVKGGEIFGTSVIDMPNSFLKGSLVAVAVISFSPNLLSCKGTSANEKVNLDCIGTQDSSTSRPPCSPCRSASTRNRWRISSVSLIP
jgi:hypothetical protein